MAVAASLWSAGPGPARAAGFSDSLYAARLPKPTSLAFAPDGSGRLFVALKDTGVMVIGPDNQWRTVFARFPQLFTESECGVLGLCFDPDFNKNHYVYIFATVSRSEQRIFRLRDYGSRGIGRVTIVRGLPTLGKNHDGGALAFGPDGRLYWGVGDNGVKRGVDGDLQSLNAKVGRASRSGVAPIDNPFHDGSGPRNDFIWATGFRNPFKMTFQPQTGRLWLNVVGSTPEGQTSPNSGPGFEQIFALHAGEDGGYDDFEGNQPNGARFSSPLVRPLAKAVLQYRTDYTTAQTNVRRTISSVEKGEGEFYTFTVPAPMPYHPGEILTYTGGGMTQPLLVSTVSANGFTARGVNPDIPSSGGSVAPLANNGCVVGGTFFESSLVPGGFQGSYLFGDYNSGSIFRASVDEAGQPKAVQPFLGNGNHVTDLGVGWDGALYYTSMGSDSVHRVGYQASADAEQGLVVTPTTVRMLEGTTARLTVRLRQKPEADVVVTPAVPNTDSTSEVTVSPSTLNFTPANWQKPQIVTVSAAADLDLVDDEATIDLASTGLTSPAVRIYVKDVGAEAPVLSTSALTVAEATSGSFTVVLPVEPVRPVTLAVRRISGSTHSRVDAGANLLFTKENWSVPQTVEIAAKPDHNRKEDQTVFGVSGSGYWPRSVEVTMPEAGVSASE